MRVVWDPEAKKARTQVANYIRREFGAKRKIPNWCISSMTTSSTLPAFGTPAWTMRTKLHK